MDALLRRYYANLERLRRAGTVLSFEPEINFRALRTVAFLRLYPAVPVSGSNSVIRVEWRACTLEIDLRHSVVVYIDRENAEVRASRVEFPNNDDPPVLPDWVNTLLMEAEHWHMSEHSTFRSRGAGRRRRVTNKRSSGGSSQFESILRTALNTAVYVGISQLVRKAPSIIKSVLKARR